MKKIFISVAATCFFTMITGNGFSQDKKQIQKDEEIVIRKNNDSKTKTTVVIDSSGITINGQPLEDYKGDVKVIKRNLIRGGSQNFTYSPRFKFDEDQFNLNRTFLGVLSEKSGKGALVKTITKGSAAEKAGLKAEDVITKLGAKTISSPEDLASAVRDHKPGDEVKIQYLRGGKEKVVNATLGKSDQAMTFNFDGNGPFEGGKAFSFRSPDFPKLDNLRSFNFFDRNQPRLGLRIQDTEDGNGVKILNVEEGSAADKAGLKKDDVITELNNQKVNSVTDVREKLSSSEDKAHYSIKAKRNNSDMNFDVQIPKQLKSADL